MKQSFDIIDIKGKSTEVAVTKKLISTIGIAIVLYFIFSAFPLDSYGDKSAAALGFLVAGIFLISMLPTAVSFPAMAIAVVGILMNFWEWTDVTATFAASPFFNNIGMTIVALGAEFTPFGRRVSYYFIKKFGKSPVKMVAIVGIITALISAFVSNIATMILMSGICATMLHAMGEEPGKSKFGKALMLVVSMSSMVGGIVLISGSPVGNGLGISSIENASGGAYTISYAQWASISIPCFLIVAIPMCIIYVKCCKLHNSDVQVLDESYYDEKLKELGPFTGEEVRWLIIVATMVGLMLAGFNTTVVAIGMAVVALCPIIGVLPSTKAMKSLPIDIVISVGFIPIIGNLFTNFGLGDLFASIIGPIVSRLGPLGFAIASAFIMTCMVNYCVNACIPMTVLVLSVLTPVCVSLGYNPTIILMPSCFVASQFFIMGSNAMMLMNKGYGYWEMKDTILPGFLVTLMFDVVFSVVAYILGPMFGMAIYI